MRKTAYGFVILFLSAFLGTAFAAQTRVSDKDIEAMMKNLSEDAKKFTSSFNSGVSKSSIRRTSREKESKQLVKRFEQQTAGMLKNFKKNKKAESEIQLVRASADKIDQLLNEVNLDERTVANWKKLKEELGLVSKGLGVPE